VIQPRDQAPSGEAIEAQEDAAEGRPRPGAADRARGHRPSDGVAVPRCGAGTILMLADGVSQAEVARRV